MKKRITRHKERHNESARYVLINNPTYLRKDILTNALDIVKLLKNYESFKDLRSQRLSLSNNLKILMNDIHNSFLSLHRKLPIDESLRLELHRKTDVPLKTLEIPKIKEIHSEFTEEDRIQDELRKVESRLRRMNL